MSLWTLTATAQEPVAETTSPVATETDSLQRVVDDLSQQLRHQKNEELDRKIWKNRSKYFNLGYVKQSLVFKDFGDEKLKNDFGVSISWGKTYFTCTKLLQKSEMRKDIVIELSYRGFSCTSDYS